MNESNLMRLNHDTMKKRDKTIINPSDSPPSLEIEPIGFKQKAKQRELSLMALCYD